MTFPEMQRLLLLLMVVTVLGVREGEYVSVAQPLEKVDTPLPASHSLLKAATKCFAETLRIHGFQDMQFLSMEFSCTQSDTSAKNAWRLYLEIRTADQERRLLAVQNAPGQGKWRCSPFEWPMTRQIESLPVQNSIWGVVKKASLIQSGSTNKQVSYHFSPGTQESSLANVDTKLNPGKIVKLAYDAGCRGRWTSLRLGQFAPTQETMTFWMISLQRPDGIESKVYVDACPLQHETQSSDSLPYIVEELVQGRMKILQTCRGHLIKQSEMPGDQTMAANLPPEPEDQSRIITEQGQSRPDVEPSVNGPAAETLPHDVSEVLSGLPSTSRPAPEDDALPQTKRRKGPQRSPYK